jgi:hypothetical protein
MIVNARSSVHFMPVDLKISEGPAVSLQGKLDAARPNSLGRRHVLPRSANSSRKLGSSQRRLLEPEAIVAPLRPSRVAATDRHSARFIQ